MHPKHQMAFNPSTTASYSGAAPACQCGSLLLVRFHQRIMNELTRRALLGGSLTALAGLFSGLISPQLVAAHPTPSAPLALTHLRLFDGERLHEGQAIWIENGKIRALLAENALPADLARLDCQGKTVIPGLIDAHWHTTLAAITQAQAMTADLGYVHLVAGREAERTLMRGFTSVRDVGGPAFALKRAIDEGLIPGPRIYPAGAMISQTSGHGDFRLRHELPRSPLSPLAITEQAGVAVIADGEAEVLRRTREQLMLGASQIKLMAGGGVASSYDPLDSVQFSERELRAAVEAAADWGTYVMTHVYTSAGIQRALRAGVRSIEHGQLADEETVRMMADQGAWWSLQPFLQDEDSNVYPDEARRASQAQVAQGTLRAYELAQRFGVATAWGTDVLFNPQNTQTQGRQLAKMTRFYSPLTALKMATADNGALLGLSGPRNPYPAPLGRIEAQAWADLLVVEGDPERSLDFLSDPERNLCLIMKGGQIYKNTLSNSA
ncbi:amidohydrolase family protein [Marinospirillum sp. MEB164]|uniref:Amidohydrolase family protein n=1 Tax=Marinospirillum alkalitolerans TaxID=3123374 RepID=A0ABW8PTG2_9GAMM